MTTAAKLADSGLSIELQPEEKIAASMKSVPVQPENRVKFEENEFMFFGCKIWFFWPLNLTIRKYFPNRQRNSNHRDGPSRIVRPMTSVSATCEPCCQLLSLAKATQGNIN